MLPGGGGFAAYMRNDRSRCVMLNVNNHNHEKRTMCVV